MKKVYLFIITIYSILNVFGQGADNCSTAITALDVPDNSYVYNTFNFTSSLTPTTTVADPTNFYYTVTSDNEIFTDKTICKDLWYKVKIPSSGGVIIDLIHSGSSGTSDLAMAVYTACNGTLIAAADDYYTTGFYLEPSVAISCQTPGNYVYVRIWRYGCTDDGLPSTFQIWATDQAYATVGDAPSSAVPLSGTASTTTNVDINSSLYPLMAPVLPTNFCSNAGYAISGGCEDKWFKLTLPPDKILDVSVINASTNITTQVFKGTTACNLTKVGCGSDVLNPLIPDISFSTSTDVYIRVFDQNCDEYDNFDLVTTIRPKNSNDEPCTATTLTLGAANISDTIINYTPSNISPQGACVGNGAYCRDGWFKVTANATGTMKIYLNVTGNIGTSPNSIYATAYKATSCSGSLSLIGCNAPITLNDSLQFYVNNLDVIYIRIQDYNCDTNAHEIYTIRAILQTNVPNDNMCNAIPLNANDSLSGTLQNATQSTETPFPTYQYNTVNICEDVWYSYTFTEPGTFDLVAQYVSGTNTTSEIAVYKDGNTNPCDGSVLTAISNTTSTNSIADINCIEGVTGEVYYFRVYDYNCDNSDRVFKLYSYFTPAGNSYPCNARSLDFGLLVDTAETCGVISSPIGTPDPTGCGFTSNANCESVWFKATIPSSGSIGITINPNYFSSTGNDIAIQGYVDTDNNPCNGGLSLQGVCTNSSSLFIKSYSGLTPGNQLYIRVWDYNCDGLKDFSIQVTSNNDVLLSSAVSGTTISVACGEDINFYDDGGPFSNYSSHAPRTVTFEAPPGYRLRVEEQAIDVSPARTNTACVNQNTGGNDVLTIYDGTTSGNKIAAITGSLTTTGRFGTFVANSGKISFNFDADNSSTKGAGFHFIIKCEVPVNIQKQLIDSGFNATYVDPGGLLNDYPNNAFEIKTFCPTATALSKNEKIQAILNAFQMESVADKIYVFDGDSTNAPLIGTFSGAQTLTNINKLGTIRASASNTSGCLTFMFVSDATVTAPGFNAIIKTGKPIGANGAETCAGALDISAGGKFQANTFLATGDPRSLDPNLCIAACTAGSGTQPITQLEGTIWYKFTTPNITCATAPLFTLDFTNVSTLMKGDANASYPNGTSGAQVVLYQTSSCLASGSNWEPYKVVCYDILQNGGDVNVSGLLPNTTYYLMLDNFGGRPTNLDIIANINVVDNDNDGACDVLPVELLYFTANLQSNQDVLLNWKTVSEINNDYFVIERSEDNIVFTTISQHIEAAGTTHIPQTYAYTDVQPFVNGVSTLYYRLKQVDFNGTFTYSTIQMVRYINNNFYTSIYPNPTKDDIQVEINAANNKSAMITITAINGNILLNKPLSIFAGFNQFTIDISNFPSGVYYVRIIGNDELPYVKTIIKMD